ncbi:MAG TPA: iron hydrogenase small subunit [Candidatus Avimonoglobus intestinipullorum]|uniref:Iron hydrogenase small subunit n=1 Tax=Candidatus Avimonoglobus intestinipullorum TaxID=2840699 RepID=A0A9D1LUL0_9FIRM|nr:iron hydrogenase small subunit [Candidatus Avimonoglobus intestinipullorum]
MKTVNLKINGQSVSVPENYTVLEAAREAGIDIPTLCYLKDYSETGSCRMCVVEIVGARALQAACVYPVAEGLEVLTHSPKVKAARKSTLELLLSNHDRQCLTCVRNKNCELQTLSDELGITDIAYEGERNEYDIDDLSPSIVRDNNKCILCRRCVNVCKNVQTVGVIDATERGFKTKIACAFDSPLAATACVNCGQCIAACPTGALREKDNTDEVWAALADDSKYVVVQAAPAVRAALGEEFGLPIGTPVTGKMAAALRRLGFDSVFDTDTGADLTIMEEGTELLERLNNGGKLPMITSCSPGWIKFCEHNFPDFLDNLSTCKSPHQMFGAIIKTYFAQKRNIPAKNIVTVSVMPCVAKKFEAKRPEMQGEYRDVDIVISTRELARMIKQAGIQFTKLPDEKFDSPFEEASGAGVIFGATGGVMEAALRTVAEIVEGKPLDNVEFTAVRGTEGIKEATVTLGGKDIRVAIAHGLGNARALLESIRSGEKNYEFIEIMACPGGCVTGGGQPIVSAKTQMDIDVKAERAKALYTEDANLPCRKSHENPDIQLLYKEFLEKPGSHKAHELLHTHYMERELY